MTTLDLVPPLSDSTLTPPPSPPLGDSDRDAVARALNELHPTLGSPETAWRGKNALRRDAVMPVVADIVARERQDAIEGMRAEESRLALSTLTATASSCLTQNCGPDQGCDPAGCWHRTAQDMILAALTGTPAEASLTAS